MRTLKNREELSEMRHILRPFFFFFVLFFFSCRSDTQEFPGTSGTIDVRSGNSFIIFLKENHSRGENWVVVKDFESSRIKYLGSNYHGQSSGRTDFIFSSGELGETVIQFNLLAYGEVIKNQKVKVTVK